MLIIRGVLLDVRSFFVKISFHSATQWRIKLRYVANLHSESGQD
jgi:hypothetical protein